jgi:hypothetical protein
MASDQIRQMVNFILQEAHEKANEIRVKVRFFRQFMPAFRVGDDWFGLIRDHPDVWRK